MAAALESIGNNGSSSNSSSIAALPLVGKKLMNQLGGMVNENAASEISAFARKQMEKMGWQQGKGLGKQEQGMVSYVKVKKREDLMGLGVEKQKAAEPQNQWWYNAYDKIASKIKIDGEENADTKEKKKRKKKNKKMEKAKKRKLDDDSDDTSEPSTTTTTAAAAARDKYRVPTDEELFAATGGKLFGRRAYGSCLGKLKRDELLQKGQIPNTQMPPTKKNKKSKSKRKVKKPEEEKANDPAKQREEEKDESSANTTTSSSSSSSSEEDEEEDVAASEMEIAKHKKYKTDKSNKDKTAKKSKSKKAKRQRTA